MYPGNGRGLDTDMAGMYVRTNMGCGTDMAGMYHFYGLVCNPIPILAGI